MQNTFDIAPLAIVAYAEVIGATGLSPNVNSGVTTSRLSAGRYTLTLPANMLQSSNRDLIFVQPKVAAPVGTPVSASVDDTSVQVKAIDLYNGTTFADCDFSVIVLRTVITPPAGSPG